MQALIKELASWFSKVMDDLYEEWPDHIDGVLMGCPIWGKTYRERFEHYCLPTLAAPENLAALRGRCRLVLFSDGEGRSQLLRMLKPLEQHGIEFVLLTIPPAVLARAEERELDRYPILGCVQNMLIQMAGRYCMGLHMLMPDHSYPERYFPKMFALGEKYEAIVQCGLCVDIDSAKWEIEDYRTADKELIIPSHELGDLGWRHLHKRMRMLVVNNAPDGKMPQSHFLMYQGRDRLRIHSPHMNPVWLSARLCLKADLPREPKTLIATIDTRLPALIDGTPVHIVQPEDEMMVIEVSDDTKAAPSKFVEFDDFAMRAWQQIGFSDSFDPLFNSGCEIAIAPQDSHWSDAAISQHHSDTFARMHALKPRLGLEAYQKLVGTWNSKRRRSPLEAPEDYEHIIRGIVGVGQEAEAAGEAAPGRGPAVDRGRAGGAPGDGGQGDGREEDRAGADAGRTHQGRAANGAAGGVFVRP
jgi:hypothetical protein